LKILSAKTTAKLDADLVLLVPDAQLYRDNLDGSVAANSLANLAVAARR
jgi:hypothetical protein